MLKVTIVNIDGSFHAIYDHDDKQKAAEALLAALVADHGFFKENRIGTAFPSCFTPDADVYGLLLMPDEGQDEEDLEYRVDHENTYWVKVQEYEPGGVITDR